MPLVLKPPLFELLMKLSSITGNSPWGQIFRLPFGLVLKATTRSTSNEGDALHFLEDTNGINTPVFITFVSTPQRSYLVSTWIDGDCLSDVWDELTPTDVEHIIEDLRSQFKALHDQTSTPYRTLCNASGGGIIDPRVPWVSDNPCTFPSYREFMALVWPGLRSPWNVGLAKMIRPLIERDDVPIVFSHSDLLPRNIIIQGGLKLWRCEPQRYYLCMVDWEYAGWMPLPWDALKGTWLFRPDDQWYKMMVAVFPESGIELDADWEWRLNSRVTLI